MAGLGPAQVQFSTTGMDTPQLRRPTDESQEAQPLARKAVALQAVQTEP